MIQPLSSATRRNFIHGAGLSLALPWLESMGANSSKQGDTPKRFVSVYLPNGVGMPLAEDPAFKDWSWFPHGGERDFKFTKVLDPLESQRENFTVYKGLSHPAARTVHGHSNADQYLTGADIPGSGLYQNTISIDQVIAEKIGNLTRQSSLVMSCNGGTGAPRGTHTQSFNRDGRPIPPLHQPKQIFDNLFVAKSTDARAQLSRSMSALDTLLESTKALQRKLSSHDQKTLGQYLDSVRDTEKTSLKAQKWLDTPMPHVEPGDLALEATPKEARNYIQSIYGLMYLAFLNDTTRVSTFSYGRENGGGINDYLSSAVVKAKAHQLTHEVKKPGGWKNLGLFNRFQAEEFGRFIQKLSDTKEANGNGSMLDNTFALHGSASSSFHLSRNYPLLSAGGKNLGFNNGRFLKFGKGNENNQSNAGILSDVGWRSKMDYEEEALGHLFVTILKRFDVETNNFAGCEGGLARV